MTTESWLALGASALVLLSAVVRTLALSSEPRWRLWTAVPAAARVGAVLLLLAVLSATGIGATEWLPSDGPRMALSLALAMLVIDMLLAWRLGVDGGGPVLDLVALVLILLAAYAAQVSSAPTACTQLPIPACLEWLLLLLGSATALVASSCGLMLALHTLRSRRAEGNVESKDPALECFLKQAVFLSLLFLGAGLVVGVWWAWQTASALAGDARHGWMAASWLVAATSLLAWQLGRHPRRWAAALAVLAGAFAVTGLFVVPELIRVFWA